MFETTILDHEVIHASERRRKLLPIWIKIFLWIFIVFGFSAPFGFIAGAIGLEFSLAAYGLETTELLSFTGLVILLIYTMKGVVSLGLWTEKDWAVDLAIIDAIIGMIACAFVMLIVPFLPENDGNTINIRLELIFLIPYLIKMKNIKAEWELRNRTSNTVLMHHATH